MAVVPQNVQLGQSWSGILRENDVPIALKDKGLDNMGELAYIHRGTTKFMNSIIHEMPKSKVTEHREFSNAEIMEMDRVFKVVTGSSAADNDSSFAVTNDQANQIIINDLLYAKDTLATTITENVNADQYNDANAKVGSLLETKIAMNVTGIQFAKKKGVRNGTYFYEHEVMYVIDKGSPNSAGPGLTTIRVRRCFFGGGREDRGGSIIPTALVNTSIGADRANSAILAGDEFMRMLPTWPEGSNYPNSFWKSPTIDNNFLQELKYGWSVTEEAKLSKSLLKDDAMTIKRRLETRRAMLETDMSLLFGRKGKTTTANGHLIYTMGGAFEAVPKDEDHIIRHAGASMDYTTLMDMVERAFALGGSENRTMYLSYKLYAEFKKALYRDSAFRFNKDQTAKFDVPVESLVGPGGQVHMMPSYAFEEAGWSRHALLVDWSNPTFQMVTHPAYDMQLKELPGDGSSIYREGLVGMKSLSRQYTQYLSIFEFI